MNAVVIDQYGSPKVLQVRRVSTPLVEDYEVLVKVHAAGLNPVDYKIRQGMLKKFYKLKFPAILGSDIAGVVAGTGNKVTDFKAGDGVYAMMPSLQMGGYAGYVAVDHHALALKPKNLSFEEAAAIPLAALTALQSLRDKGQLKRNQEVLINGASGGVGSFAVQIAKALGAVVVGVCSGENAAIVRDLGADVVLDYHKQDFTRLAAQYDIVLDAVGKRSFAECKKVLKKHGRFVSTGISAQLFVDVALSLLMPKKCKMITTGSSGDDLRMLAGFAEENMLKPVIQKVYRPEEILQAHQTLAAGHVAGKLVVKMDFN